MPSTCYCTYLSQQDMDGNQLSVLEIFLLQYWLLPQIPVSLDKKTSLAIVSNKLENVHFSSVSSRESIELVIGISLNLLGLIESWAHP